MSIIVLAFAALAIAGSRPESAPSLVVVSPNESSVSVIDVREGRILATLPTGPGPHEVTASPDGRWAVVTDDGGSVGGGTLIVVDLISLTVARRIGLGGDRRPRGIHFLPDNQTVAVTSETDGVVLLVGIPSGRIVRAIPTGEPATRLLAVSRDGRRGYAADVRSGSVAAVDLARPAAPRRLAVGPDAEAIGLSPDGAELWVGSGETGRMYLVETAAWRVVDSLVTNGRPGRIAFSPDGATVLVSSPAAEELQLFDAASHRLLARIAVPPGPIGPGPTPTGPSRPAGIAWAPDGRTAWVTLAGIGQVAEVDLEARSVRRYLPARAGADGLTYAERPPA